MSSGGSMAREPKAPDERMVQLTLLLGCHDHWSRAFHAGIDTSASNHTIGGAQLYHRVQFPLNGGENLPPTIDMPCSPCAFHSLIATGSVRCERHSRLTYMHVPCVTACPSAILDYVLRHDRLCGVSVIRRASLIEIAANQP
jgi:hypothetical protein